MTVEWCHFPYSSVTFSHFDCYILLHLFVER